MNDMTYIQKKFIEYIETIMKSDKLSHSYLIELGDSSLDFPFILLFVKMILCPESISSVDCLDCNRCNVCKLIDENNFPDLEIIEADGMQIKKKQLLSLKEEYQNFSLIGRRRVYIIREADKLNSSSANTILKFLEEPEDGIIAILLTKNRYQVLDTVLSRCQILSLIDSTEIFTIDDNTIQFIHYLLSGDDLFIYYKEILDNILPEKKIAKDFFENVEKIFIQYLSGKKNKNNSFLEYCNREKLLSYIAIIEEEIPKLMYNINYKLWLNSIFSRFVEVN